MTPKRFVSLAAVAALASLAAVSAWSNVAGERYLHADRALGA
jgi:hypothetical protein